MNFSNLMLISFILGPFAYNVFYITKPFRQILKKFTSGT